MSRDIKFVLFNYTLQSNSILTATTEDPNFPVTNLNKSQRAFIWRSNKNGNFEIVATNKFLDFDEGGGELTATLTEATFTATALATEIKTKMDAAGAGVHTITYSQTTGLWTIASTAATFNLRTFTGTNLANTAYRAIGFDVSANHTGAQTYDGSDVAIHTAERVVIDLLAAQPFDAVALVFDSLRRSQFSIDAVIKLKANAVNNFTSPAFTQNLKVDTDWDQALATFAEQNFRFTAIEIVDPRNPNLQVELGKIVLGFSTETQRLPDNGFEFPVEDTSSINSNDYGNEYSDIFTFLRTISFNFSALSQDDIEALEIAYREVGSTTPIYVIVDPDHEHFKPEQYSMYGKFSRSFSASHRIQNFQDLPFEIREVM